MKLGFYPRLAWSGIRKNKRLFVPYILAAAGTAAVFYIMFYLASGDLLDGMRGGRCRSAYSSSSRSRCCSCFTATASSCAADTRNSAFTASSA